MKPADIHALGLAWMDDPFIRFATKHDFVEPGDNVIGIVVHYHPTWGASNWDRTADCGVLILREAPDKWVKVALDKGNLATAVANAMVVADRSRLRVFVMGVKYVGMSGGRDPYRRFVARVAEPTIASLRVFGEDRL